MNQLMNGGQRVLVCVILPPVHRPGSSWHLLFFNSQQSHNKSIFWEARQCRELFDLLCVHSGHTKHPSVPLWVLEVPSPEIIYAQNTGGFWAGHDGVLFPLVLCKAHLSLQCRQFLASPCHCRDPDGFCAPIPWWYQRTLYINVYQSLILLWVWCARPLNPHSPVHPVIPLHLLAEGRDPLLLFLVRIYC